MSPILNRLERLGIWARVGLVAALALVQILTGWLLPHIWTPALLGIVLGSFLLPGRLSVLAVTVSGASLLANWRIAPHATGSIPLLHYLTEIVQILLFAVIMTWTIRTAAQRLRFLDAVSEGTGEFVYLIDSRGMITYINEVAARELGYSREELTGRPFMVVIPAWAHEEIWKRVRASLVRRQPAETRVPVLTSQGKELVILVRARSFTVNGRAQVLGVGRNVTDAERTERLFTAAFDASADPTVIRDQEGRILACNEAYAQSLGRSKAELVGTALPPFGLSPDQLPQWSAGLSGEPSHSEVQVAGGRTIRVISSPILDEREMVVCSLTLISDVTHEKEAEARLVQTAGLAAVGQVAAGAAHNINNILAAISVSAELLNLDAATLGPIVAKDILAAVERGSGITRKLYRLAGHGDRPKLEPVRASEAFREVLQLVEPQFARKGITVVQEVPGDALVRADAGLLHQVLMNLVINALQAMTAGDTLTLRARVLGATVDLEVRDTGVGIMPEHMGQLFTPFFTTRASDLGTGLGLSTSLQMVRAMQGEIRAESRVGVGSTFVVRLPAGR
ncbi:MAG TPA: PAS domain S-box protein [Symbiobacteriaceae bacterium]|jgi:PAS domain S-box-containing protein|nr:PAS domain S-box protein [Symbiobacteriaceae bacterium]